MPDRELLNERIDTIERTLTGSADSTLEDLPERVTALETQVAELEATIQALRGYVGNIQHVNSEVERRADAALAAVESIEEVDELRAADGSRIELADGHTNGDSDNVPVDPTLLARIRESL
jgi:uncharacterized coiled-coil protein SlyX